MNHGNQVMATYQRHPRTTSWRVPASEYLRQGDATCGQRLHQQRHRRALPIFPALLVDLDSLYGAVDGQKFGVERPTVKARYSRKYFGRGKGVVAYTLLLAITCR